MRNKLLIFMCLLFAISFISCEEETLPKPKAILRLDFPENKQGIFRSNNFSFGHNLDGKVELKNSNAITINYPQMKATIFLSYIPVKNNLNKLLSDAQKLSYEHAAKADIIKDKLFINDKSKVYGMFYDVKGDAASQAQFYVTDSTKHFLTGSLYFNIKPNYDSIYPAAVYLQEDIRQIMETLRWTD